MATTSVGLALAAALRGGAAAPPHSAPSGGDGGAGAGAGAGAAAATPWEPASLAAPPPTAKETAAAQEAALLAAVYDRLTVPTHEGDMLPADVAAIFRHYVRIGDPLNVTTLSHANFRKLARDCGWIKTTGGATPAHATLDLLYARVTRGDAARHGILAMIGEDKGVTRDTTFPWLLARVALWRWAAGRSRTTLAAASPAPRDRSASPAPSSPDHPRGGGGRYHAHFHTQPAPAAVGPPPPLLVEGDVAATAQQVVELLLRLLEKAHRDWDVGDGSELLHPTAIEALRRGEGVLQRIYYAYTVARDSAITSVDFATLSKIALDFAISPGVLSKPALHAIYSTVSPDNTPLLFPGFLEVFGRIALAAFGTDAHMAAHPSPGHCIDSLFDRILAAADKLAAMAAKEREKGHGVYAPTRLLTSRGLAGATGLGGADATAALAATHRGSIVSTARYAPDGSDTLRLTTSRRVSLANAAMAAELTSSAVPGGAAADGAPASSVLEGIARRRNSSVVAALRSSSGGVGGGGTALTSRSTVAFAGTSAAHGPAGPTSAFSPAFVPGSGAAATPAAPLPAAADATAGITAFDPALRRVASLRRAHSAGASPLFATAVLEGEGEGEGASDAAATSAGRDEADGTALTERSLQSTPEREAAAAASTSPQSPSRPAIPPLRNIPGVQPPPPPGRVVPHGSAPPPPPPHVGAVAGSQVRQTGDSSIPAHAAFSFASTSVTNGGTVSTGPDAAGLTSPSFRRASAVAVGVGVGATKSFKAAFAATPARRSSSAGALSKASRSAIVGTQQPPATPGRAVYAGESGQVGGGNAAALVASAAGGVGTAVAGESARYATPRRATGVVAPLYAVTTPRIGASTTAGGGIASSPSTSRSSRSPLPGDSGTARPSVALPGAAVAAAGDGGVVASGTRAGAGAGSPGGVGYGVAGTQLAGSFAASQLAMASGGAAVPIPIAAAATLAASVAAQRRGLVPTGHAALPATALIAALSATTPIGAAPASARGSIAGLPGGGAAPSPPGSARMSVAIGGGGRVYVGEEAAAMAAATAIMIAHHAGAQTKTAAAMATSSAAATGYFVQPTIVSRLCAQYASTIPRIKPLFLFYARIGDPGNTGRMSATNLYRLLRDLDALDEAVTTGDVHLQLLIIARTNAVASATGVDSDSDAGEEGRGSRAASGKLAATSRSLLRKAAASSAAASLGGRAGRTAPVASADATGLTLDDWFEALARVSELIRRAHVRPHAMPAASGTVGGYSDGDSHVGGDGDDDATAEPPVDEAERTRRAMEAEYEQARQCFGAFLSRRVLPLVGITAADDECAALVETPEVVAALAEQAHFLRRVFSYYCSEQREGGGIAVYAEEWALFARDFEVLPSLMTRGDVDAIFYACARRAGTDVGPPGRMGRSGASGMGGTSGARRGDAAYNTGFSTAFSSLFDGGNLRASSPVVAGARRGAHAAGEGVARRKGGGGLAAATVSMAYREADTAFLTFPSFAEAVARMALQGFARPFLIDRCPTPAHKVRGLFQWLYASRAIMDIEATDWTQGRSRGGRDLTPAQLTGESSDLVARLQAIAAAVRSTGAAAAGQPTGPSAVITAALVRDSSAAGHDADSLDGRSQGPTPEHKASSPSLRSSRGPSVFTAVLEPLLHAADGGSERRTRGDDRDAAVATGGSGDAQARSPRSGGGSPRTARASVAVSNPVTLAATFATLSKGRLGDIADDGGAAAGTAAGTRWRGRYSADDRPDAAVALLTSRRRPSDAAQQSIAAAEANDEAAPSQAAAPTAVAPAALQASYTATSSAEEVIAAEAADAATAVDDGGDGDELRVPANAGVIASSLSPHVADVARMAHIAGLLGVALVEVPGTGGPTAWQLASPYAHDYQQPAVTGSPLDGSRTGPHTGAAIAQSTNHPQPSHLDRCLCPPLAGLGATASPTTLQGYRDRALHHIAEAVNAQRAAAIEVAAAHATATPMPPARPTAAAAASATVSGVAPPTTSPLVNGALRLSQLAAAVPGARASTVAYDYTSASTTVGDLGSHAPAQRYGSMVAAVVHGGSESVRLTQTQDAASHASQGYAPLFHRGEMLWYARQAAARSVRLAQTVATLLRPGVERGDIDAVLHVAAGDGTADVGAAVAAAIAGDAAADTLHAPQPQQPSAASRRAVSPSPSAASPLAAPSISTPLASATAGLLKGWTSARIPMRTPVPPSLLQAAGFGTPMTAYASMSHAGPAAASGGTPAHVAARVPSDDAALASLHRGEVVKAVALRAMEQALLAGRVTGAGGGDGAAPATPTATRPPGGPRLATEARAQARAAKALEELVGEATGVDPSLLAAAMPAATAALLGGGRPHSRGRRSSVSGVGADIIGGVGSDTRYAADTTVRSQRAVTAASAGGGRRRSLSGDGAPRLRRSSISSLVAVDPTATVTAIQSLLAAQGLTDPTVILAHLQATGVPLPREAVALLESQAQAARVEAQRQRDAARSAGGAASSGATPSRAIMTPSGRAVDIAALRSPLTGQVASQWRDNLRSPRTAATPSHAATPTYALLSPAARSGKLRMSWDDSANASAVTAVAAGVPQRQLTAAPAHAAAPASLQRRSSREGEAAAAPTAAAASAVVARTLQRVAAPHSLPRSRPAADRSRSPITLAGVKPVRQWRRGSWLSALAAPAHGEDAAPANAGGTSGGLVPAATASRGVAAPPLPAAAPSSSELPPGGRGTVASPSTEGQTAREGGRARRLSVQTVFDEDGRPIPAEPAATAAATEAAALTGEGSTLRRLPSGADVLSVVPPQRGWASSLSALRGGGGAGGGGV